MAQWGTPGQTSFLYSELFPQAGQEKIVADRVVSIYLLEINTQLLGCRC